VNSLVGSRTRCRLELTVGSEASQCSRPRGWRQGAQAAPDKSDSPRLCARASADSHHVGALQEPPFTLPTVVGPWATAPGMRSRRQFGRLRSPRAGASDPALDAPRSPGLCLAGPGCRGLLLEARVLVVLSLTGVCALWTPGLARACACWLVRSEAGRAWPERPPDASGARAC